MLIEDNIRKKLWICQSILKIEISLHVAFYLYFQRKLKIIKQVQLQLSLKFWSLISLFGMIIKHKFRNR